jgi:hypothetical protein
MYLLQRPLSGQPTQARLSGGKPTRRELSTGETHLYSLEVTAGQYLELVLRTLPLPQRVPGVRQLLYGSLTTKPAVRASGAMRAHRFRPDACHIFLGGPRHESKEVPSVAGHFQALWTIGEMRAYGFLFALIQLSGIKRHNLTIFQTCGHLSRLGSRQQVVVHRPP